MNPFEHSLCSDHLTPSSEGSHSRRFDLHMFLPVHEPPQFPCADIFSNPLDQGEHREFDHPVPAPLLEADEHFLSIGSSWQQSSRRPSSSPLPMISKDDEDRKKKKNSTVTSGENVPSSMKSGSSGRWLTSSKLKSTVRKVVMNPDRITGSNMLQARDPPAQQSMSTTDGGSSNKNGGQLLSCSGTGMIRVCSDCNTTKTPLWRSGPSGPKSLCNACGIRRRKARRAMAAAAAGLIPAAAVGPSSKLQRKEKMSEGGSSSTMPFKKRCKFMTSAQTSKQLHFDDDVLALDWSKNPTGRLQRVFPQDEKEAAMLLMALSCGLIRG